MDCSLPGSSVGFPRQEYWSGLQFPSSGTLSDLGIEPMTSTFAGGFFTTESSENSETLACSLAIICASYKFFFFGKVGSQGKLFHDFCIFSDFFTA